MSFGKQIDELLYVSGQPTVEQFAQLPTMGFTRIIDLRPACEDHGFDEPKAAMAAAVQYLSLPIATAADLTHTAVSQLDQWLGESTTGKTLLHCASSNRVGALLALRAVWHQRLTAQDSLRMGRLAGLKSMESAVIDILERRGA